MWHYGKWQTSNTWPVPVNVCGHREWRIMIIECMCASWPRNCTCTLWQAPWWLSGEDECLRDMKCTVHDLEVKGSNSGQDFGCVVLLSRTWTKKISIASASVWEAVHVHLRPLRNCGRTFLFKVLDGLVVLEMSISGAWNALAMIWRSWVWTLVRLNQGA